MIDCIPECIVETYSFQPSYSSLQLDLNMKLGTTAIHADERFFSLNSLEIEKKKWIELMKLNEGMIWWRCTSRCRPLRRRRPSITIRPSANRWVRHVRHVHVRHVHVPIWPMPLLDRYPTSSQTQPTKQNFICPPLTYSIA